MKRNWNQEKPIDLRTGKVTPRDIARALEAKLITQEWADAKLAEIKAGRA